MRLSPSKRRALWLISQSSHRPVVVQQYLGFTVGGTNYSVCRGTVLALEDLGFLRRTEHQLMKHYPFIELMKFDVVDGMYLNALFQEQVSLADEHLVDWVLPDDEPFYTRGERGRRRGSKLRKLIRGTRKRALIDPFDWRAREFRGGAEDDDDQEKSR